jgi:hypothetical protein
MITNAVTGPSVMVNLLSFEATRVFTVVGHRGAYAVDCRLETMCLEKIELSNWCLRRLSSLKQSVSTSSLFQAKDPWHEALMMSHCLLCLKDESPMIRRPPYHDETSLNLHDSNPTLPLSHPSV